MRKHLIPICSLAAIGIVSVLTFVQAGANNLPRLSPPADDAATQKCIEDKLTKSASLKAAGITVAVADGVATLTGHVNKMGLKGDATNIAKSCGPKSVANNIIVEKAAPVDDAAIQKCISDKFAASSSLNSQGFSDTVSSGVATLTGTAKDAGSKGAATNIAKHCGAKKVVNNISAPAVTKHP